MKKIYRDCIKNRRGITRHIMMHQVLYIVQLPNEGGDMHIMHLVHHDIPIWSLLHNPYIPFLNCKIYLYSIMQAVPM